MDFGILGRLIRGADPGQAANLSGASTLVAGLPSASILVQGKNHQGLNRDIGRPSDALSELILEFMQGKAPGSFPPSI